ncbi:MAG: M20/M25/M40 family metallo-hydrolase [Chitinophagales bacterium]|nr:M20/M25/M40 family metallo-hydrolase [Chitinophagales bacterium]
MQTGRWLLSITAIVLFVPAMAQKVSDKKVVKQLKKDIGYLASDKLEGRRTGSEGEKLASDYITKYYEQQGIATYKSKDLYPFTFTIGRTRGADNHMTVNGKELVKGEWFPISFSANGKAASDVTPGVMEGGKIWMEPMFEDEEQSKDPHFNWEKDAFERCEEAVKQGAKAVVFYDEYDAKYPAVFNKKTEYEALSIPVAYITYKGYKQYVFPHLGASVQLAFEADLKDKELTGHNVLFSIDNGAKYTVVLGAHYDHLGHGEDGNSLYAKKDGSIHNGADDNASGTAALMQIAGWVKDAGLKNYNYVFMHFSAEELGLIGSKKIVEELGLDSNKVAYMINMDMVGRLNDSTHSLTVGGVGTSPVWGKVVNTNDERFKIGLDSSGVGPSDHTSFYYKGIPVLFFFTGTHSDYHKPSDDADKINYEGEAAVMHYIFDIVKQMDGMSKPAFRETKQTTVGKVRFKVTLGVMPDYAFNDGGLRIDGVTDGRPAANAGLKGGDIIIKMGDNEIRGIQTYMEALGKFEEGDKTTITFKRDGKEITKPLVFTPKPE